MGAFWYATNLDQNFWQMRALTGGLCLQILAMSVAPRRIAESQLTQKCSSKLNASFNLTIIAKHACNVNTRPLQQVFKYKNYTYMI